MRRKAARAAPSSGARRSSASNHTIQDGSTPSAAANRRRRFSPSSHPAAVGRDGFASRTSTSGSASNPSRVASVDPSSRASTTSAQGRTASNHPGRSASPLRTGRRTAMVTGSASRAVASRRSRSMSRLPGQDWPASISRWPTTWSRSRGIDHRRLRAHSSSAPVVYWASGRCTPRGSWSSANSMPMVTWLGSTSAGRKPGRGVATAAGVTGGVLLGHDADETTVEADHEVGADPAVGVGEPAHGAVEGAHRGVQHDAQGPVTVPARLAMGTGPAVDGHHPDEATSARPWAGRAPGSGRGQGLGAPHGGPLDGPGADEAPVVLELVGGGARAGEVPVEGGGEGVTLEGAPTRRGRGATGPGDPVVGAVAP